MATDITLNLKPSPVNLQLYQGDDVLLTFHLVSGGSNVNITGWTGKAQIRLNEASSTVLAELTVTLTSASTGVFTISTDSATTTALPEQCVWDLQFTTAGKVRTYMKGKVFVTRQVAR